MSELEFDSGELNLIRAALEAYIEDCPLPDLICDAEAIIGDIDVAQPVVEPGTILEDTGDLFITLGNADTGASVSVAVGSYAYQHDPARWDFLTTKQARTAAQALLSVADLADEENGR